MFNLFPCKDAEREGEVRPVGSDVERKPISLVVEEDPVGSNVYLIVFNVVRGGYNWSKKFINFLCGKVRNPGGQVMKNL